MVWFSSMAIDSRKALKKAESGAQLLARLSTRPDLTPVDPFVFGNFSSHGSTCCGQVVELYGPEGSGKSELALHYIAKTCLPTQWKGYPLGGLGAKVIFIDTEYKFSILRLAIVIEKLFSEMVQQGSSSRRVSNQNKCEACGEDISALDSSDTCKNGYIKVKAAVSSDGLKQCKHKNTSKTNLTCQHGENGAYKRDVTPDLSRTDEGTIQPTEGTATLLLQETDEVVLDALGRVQVIKVQSTQQLLATLLSLEHALSSEPQLALVVIDTISAFYWLDKALDPSNFHSTEVKMAPIVNAISKYVSELGVSFLVVKEDVIGKKKNWNDKEYMHSKSEGSKQSEKEKVLSEHVPYLGRSWESFPVKRIVLTKHSDVKDRKLLTTWCSDWPDGRRFVFVDDGIKFL
ncbi:DNA repair protein XRCC2-like [Physella acuta]|uniref:DNA repair protein XRCC2-like n=1 Tax=Physella acuta TaxID=109671 RepID=UPI0027DD75FC|nr:DNA repair protein XRCC2-like [Physella acuta]XP_059152155.1 DNA repair protein XRCC2-like [Physella acuta]